MKEVGKATANYKEKDIDILKIFHSAKHHLLIA